MIFLSKIVFLGWKVIYTIARTVLLNKVQWGKNIELHTIFQSSVTK